MNRVYLDMVGDLFHVGHLNIIKKASELGDYLIVGVHSDEAVASYKRLPIINLEDRVSIIESCRYVDEVIPRAPLLITEDFINKHNINLIVHGSDRSKAINEQHEVPLQLGIMRYLPYTAGVSTSDLISRIAYRTSTL
jgi:cytidyltransferase-like protein